MKIKFKLYKNNTIKIKFELNNDFEIISITKNIPFFVLKKIKKYKKIILKKLND